MWNRSKIFLVEWLKAFLIGLFIFFMIRTFLFSNYVVEGESMLPTLENGNKLVVNKIGYQIHELNRFDVIVFHANKKDDYVKRIIGLPGDQIEYRNDELYINGKKCDEPYLEVYKNARKGQKLTEDFTLVQITGISKVPEGKVFVLGDNRLESWDSRYFGCIDINQIVGKVSLRYWPINDIDSKF